jgi:hypothetical protein
MTTIVRAALLAAAIAAAVSGCTSASLAPPPAPQSMATPAPTVAPSGGSVDAPVIGVAYPFELFTHCGIRWADFGGRSWAAVHPTSQPYPGGHNTTAGTMTLVSADVARFDYAEGTAEFIPAVVEPALCA